ncbi:ATP-binding protein [Pyrodictium abyssi]|uniref:ATP-binding protein n=1 Tax=Pyrodictium abyssi TaxID=54256 RepID=A0ABN6ZPV3_9CREN|nr:ATP-binding protein [Pyrodictium abyssi]
MPGSQSTVPAAPCRFVGREKELRALDEAWARRPGLVVVYGRRRVGKTRLVTEWLRLRGARSVYYLAHLSSHGHNLKRFAQRAAEQLGDPLIARLSPTSLGDLLAILARAGVEVVVIDEVTYWIRAAPIVLSELQEFVDHYLPGSRMLLVLTGSLVGVMEHEVLGGGSPLHARAATRLKLEQLEFRYLREFVPRWSSVDRVRLYAVVGGIPFYLCLVAGAESLEEALRRLIVGPGAPLREEKDMLLREELRDPHVYNAVLSALARGYDTPYRVAQATGLDPSHVSKYLHVLAHLSIVEKRVPLFKKKGRYAIRDPVIRSWFGLVEPVLELLEIGEEGRALEKIASMLDQYAAATWEDLVRQHLLRLYAPRGYQRAGFLEHRGEELDVAILDEAGKRAIVAEVEWSTLSLGEAERLRRTALEKAYRLLPGGYSVEGAYVAARGLRGGPRPPWLLLPGDLDSPAGVGAEAS